MSDDDPPATLLILEDDATTRAFLADNLSADGFLVEVAGSLAEGVDRLDASFPDAVLADVNLPDGSGLDLLRRVRGGSGAPSPVDPRTPVLVLSGRSAEVDRLRAFERGADDFLAKPYSYPELRARIRSLLRRTAERPARTRYRVGPLELDPASREVRLHDRPIELASKEFALLRALASDPSRVFTKEELLSSIWGYRCPSSTRTLDSHACRLRQKLSTHGERFVVNVWGVGYRLIDAPGNPAR